MNVRRRGLVWLGMCGLLAGLLGSGEGTAAASDRAQAAPPVPVAPVNVADEASATVAARKSGAPVEVLSKRTQRERLFANPDGSWTSEQHAMPVRVRRADGAWTGLDTGLRRIDGQVRPAATAADLQFSAGGSDPLVRLAAGGTELSLALPWSLPSPVLDGSTATYRDVLPGVDVVLTAQAEGFAEVVVVRSPEAAANPELATLRYRLAAKGLTVRAEAGGFAAVNAAGETVLVSPTPMMWDSAGGAFDRAQWPAHGDRVSQMATAVDGDTYAVVPDPAMLTDPATVFPVYLDPSVSAPRNEWAMISSGFGGDDEYYKFAGDEGMGLCDVQVESSCNADQVKRLVWEFGLPAGVRHSHVLSATFSAYETHAYDCTADAVQLWLVGGISASTNWDNHASTWSRQLASVSVARKSGCSLGPGRVEFNATSGADQAADSGWASVALGLKAGNEGSMPGGHKRFRNDATLSITYNSYPAVPTSLSANGAGCGAGASRPVISSLTPMLRAVVNDADPETDLKASFGWERWTGSAWAALGSGTQSGLSRGATGQVTIASGLVDGGTYRWRVQTLDPWSFGASSGTDPSAWSGYCEFAVDTQGPQAAPVVSSPVYGSNPNQTYGAVGLTADFTFTANGVTDVTGYKWGWADPPTNLVTAPAPGAAVTTPLTPPPPKPDDPTSAGQIALYVTSVDAAGTPSPLTTYAFTVGSATPPVGVWALKEPAGVSTFADTSGQGRTGTASNITAGAAGRILGGPGAAGPTAVSFNGTSSAVSTAGPVINTSKSFSVAGWARPTQTKYAAIVSQNGVTNNAPFDLQLGNTGAWWFDIYTADGPLTSISARSTTPAVLGKWAHVAAVYDAGAKQARLYVNGTLSATASVPSLWNGTGPLQIGRVHWGGGYASYFAGDLADVRVWNRVVSGAELAPMAATLVGRWRMDGDALDATPYGRTATATGPVLPAEDREAIPGGAYEFDGLTASLQTSGPAVRTDQSYTVSGWLRWSGVGGTRTAIAQDGANVSGFYLGCRTDLGSKWALVTRTADVASMSRAAVGGICTTEWTHVAAVIDATAGQMRLYVDGILTESVANPAPWHAGGPFTIGRAKWDAVQADPWTGAIDDVRVYAGALPASEIAKLAA